MEADLALDGVNAGDQLAGGTPTSQKRDAGHPVSDGALCRVEDGETPTRSRQLSHLSDDAVAKMGHSLVGPSFQGLALDHVGIAVRSIEAARGFYEGIGAQVAGVETVAQEGVRVAMISVGGSRIELLEATSADTVVGRFLAKRGEGLHHVALRVTGIDALFERLKGQGIRLVSDGVKVGAGGHRYFFVHPASTGGVLMEMVEGGN